MIILTNLFVTKVSVNMVRVTGKFKRQSVTNYDAFLAALGVNFAMRKAALMFTPVMEVQHDEGPML